MNTWPWLSLGGAWWRCWRIIPNSAHQVRAFREPEGLSKRRSSAVEGGARQTILELDDWSLVRAGWDLGIIFRLCPPFQAAMRRAVCLRGSAEEHRFPTRIKWMSTVHLREQAEKGASLMVELLLVRPQVSSTAPCYFPTGCNFAASGHPKGKAPPSAVYPGAQTRYSGQAGVVSYPSRSMKASVIHGGSGQGR